MNCVQGDALAPSSLQRAKVSTRYHHGCTTVQAMSESEESTGRRLEVKRRRVGGRIDEECEWFLSKCLLLELALESERGHEVSLRLNLRRQR